MSVRLPQRQKKSHNQKFSFTIIFKKSKLSEESPWKWTIFLTSGFANATIQPNAISYAVVSNAVEDNHNRNLTTEVSFYWFHITASNSGPRKKFKKQLTLTFLFSL